MDTAYIDRKSDQQPLRLVLEMPETSSCRGGKNSGGISRNPETDMVQDSEG